LSLDDLVELGKKYEKNIQAFLIGVLKKGILIPWLFFVTLPDFSRTKGCHVVSSENIAQC